MEILKTDLDGLIILQSNVFRDDRGLFIKTYYKIGDIRDENKLKKVFRKY